MIPSHVEVPPIGTDIRNAEVLLCHPAALVLTPVDGVLSATPGETPRECVALHHFGEAASNGSAGVREVSATEGLLVCRSGSKNHGSLQRSFHPGMRIGDDSLLRITT